MRFKKQMVVPIVLDTEYDVRNWTDRRRRWLQRLAQHAHLGDR